MDSKRRAVRLTYSGVEVSPGDLVATQSGSGVFDDSCKLLNVCVDTAVKSTHSGTDATCLSTAEATMYALKLLQFT